MNHLLGDIAQPNPVPAPHHAARLYRPLPAHLGAPLGAAAFLPALARRRPAKFFGGERHLSVLASTPCVRPYESAGAAQDVGKVTQVLG